LFCRYGYHQDDHNSYYFSEPKYANQDYSSQESTGGQDREVAHSIEIQPSHSYEIKENVNEGYDQQYQQQYDAVPVIVLKIPGPTKYALHLQALLQQYLELRASHLLQMLQEQDDQGLLPQVNHNAYVSQSPVPYVPMHHHQNQHNNYYYQQAQYRQAQYQQQLAYYQQQQEYYNQQAQRYQQQSQYNQQQFAYQQSQYPQVEQSYEDYSSPEPHYEQPQKSVNYVTLPSTGLTEDDHHNSELQTSENYPSDTHTQVLFKKKIKTTVHPGSGSGYHYSKPQAVVHHGYQDERPGDFYDSDHKEYHSNASMLSVTQRVRSPYNYHARASQPTLAPSSVTITTRNYKRDAPYTQEQFKKVKRVVSKMKRIRATPRQVRKPQQEQKSQ
jgi:hypothetical protein